MYGHGGPPCLPPMVIADLLGIHPKTAERWATLAGEIWSEYLSSLTWPGRAAGLLALRMRQLGLVVTRASAPAGLVRARPGRGGRDVAERR
jgi:hypothetical protein